MRSRSCNANGVKVHRTEVEEGTRDASETHAPKAGGCDKTRYGVHAAIPYFGHKKSKMKARKW